MSDQEIPIILPFSRGWKPVERTTNDTPPVMLLDDADGTRSFSEGETDLPTTSQVVRQDQCLVCQQHESRYTCPRCDLPYCSVKCYKVHTSNPSSDGTSAPRCTEAFYQGRVSSILDLEAKEQTKTIRQVLNRQFQSTYTSQSAEEEDLLTEELVQLLEDLEERDAAGRGLSEEEVFKMMSPALKASFQKDLETGTVQELLLQRWNPWWRPKLTSSNEEEENQDCDKDVLFDGRKTLDEHLLKIPAFSTIMKGSQIPNLLFNLVDVLYSCVWTQRLYHGLANVVQNNLVLEASTTFVQHSAVLNQDARYTSLEESLSVCTSASTAAMRSTSTTDGCNTPWALLVEDCALLLVSHRLVGRALLEANDLLKKSVQELKTRTTTPALEQLEEYATAEREALSRLRKIRKKIDFFLSWSQQCDEFGPGLQSQLMEWIQHWKVDEE